MLKRIIGYVHMFIKNSRIPKSQRSTNNPLLPEELKEPLHAIIKTFQLYASLPELKYIRRYNEVDKNSSISSLSPFLELKEYSASRGPKTIINNFSRCGTSNVAPLQLSHHQTTIHNSFSRKINIVDHRLYYEWGKITARSITRKCVRCTKARPQDLSAILEWIIADQFRSIIKSEAKEQLNPTYIAVFCCFATKASELELVPDLSPTAFIGALKRFNVKTHNREWGVYILIKGKKNPYPLQAQMECISS